LTTISLQGASAERYLDRVPPNIGEARTSIAGMIDASLRANEIFESIRALFSSGSLKSEPIDVNQLVAEALDLSSEELATYKIEPRLQQTPEPLSIMGHKGQLREVIINLIQNAIDAMKTVSDRRRILWIKTDRNRDEAVVISVEDTGPGIDPQKVNDLFEPFVSTKAKGMGLGLAICKSIAERHQGQLSVSSEINRGSRFELKLPINTIDQ